MLRFIAVLYRIILVVMLILAVVLTLNERYQEQRSREIAAEGEPTALAGPGGEAYPTLRPVGPTATAQVVFAPTPYPAPGR